MSYMYKAVSNGMGEKVADYIFPFLFFLLYLLFPTHLSSIDGFAFATHVQNGNELFSSHHLLYTFFGFLCFQTVSTLFDVEALVFLKFMNSLAAGFSLFLLAFILRRRRLRYWKRVLWICVVGSSWAVMRFATENETYILPICFSLWGSICFLKYLSEEKRVFLFWAGLLATVAVLFHQIHVFWWLGILLGIWFRKGMTRDGFLYLSTGLLVPLVYFLVYVFQLDGELAPAPFVEFILHDYYEGGAEFSIDKRNFILTPISFIRSFLQVHGYLFLMAAENGWNLIAMVGSGLLFLMAAISIKDLQLDFRKRASLFLISHVCIFLLQLFFAFLSHGNAEFMVMLPYLVALVLSEMGDVSDRFFIYLALGLFSWNLFFGLIPLSKREINGDRMVAEKILADSLVSDLEVYILFNRPQVRNMIEYYKDSLPPDILRYIVEFEKESDLTSYIQEQLQLGRKVYTDCVDRPGTLSRASLLIKDHGEAFTLFEKQKIDSVQSLSGRYYLTRLTLKQPPEGE